MTLSIIESDEVSERDQFFDGFYSRQRCCVFLPHLTTTRCFGRRLQTIYLRAASVGRNTVVLIKPFADLFPTPAALTASVVQVESRTTNRSIYDHGATHRVKSCEVVPSAVVSV